MLPLHGQLEQYNTHRHWTLIAGVIIIIEYVVTDTDFTMTFLVCTYFSLQESYRSCRSNITHDVLLVAIINLETCFEVYPDGIDRYLSSSEETEN